MDEDEALITSPAPPRHARVDLSASAKDLFARLAGGGSPPPASTSSGRGRDSFAAAGHEVGATVAVERCAFLAASGEEIRVTVEVIPMVPGGIRSASPASPAARRL
jgi:hypothetical protein